jgi:16S rRNA (cytidine1402-2'-O)-methyltransferase
MNQGTLYIVATPIGNLSDISQRALEVLRQVDLVAAEDTRHSKPLLHHYGIDKAMLAYHEHNEEQLTPKLVQRLLEGESIALISDAGTPLLSDPGYRLVKMAHEAGLRVSPIPGACAAIAALSASGLATDRFLFAGFPPHKQGARQRFYEELRQQSSTLIFYESSHRVLASVTDMRDVFGAQRSIVLAREISKTFETIHSSTLAALPEWIAADANQQKGEFVLVVQGAALQADELAVELEHVLGVLLGELPVKQAAQMAARITGLKKNQVYQRALQITGK